MVNMQDMSDPSRHSNKLLECDIVMAGGVTSGIIYPGAVAMIARRYSFQSIGGTSVGAIAAAVTAAAEYGRRTGRNSRAFEQIAALPQSLGDTSGDGHSRLYHLFTPEPTTEPLLRLMTPIFGGGGSLKKIVRILKASLSAWQVSVPVVIATLGSLAMTISLVAENHHLLAVIGLITTASLSLVVGLAMLAVMLNRLWLPAWRENGYGICTGSASPQCGKNTDQAIFEGLTPWMHRVVQVAAGRKHTDPPLTFGDLWSACSTADSAIRITNPAAPRAIELAMIASDISRNRTVQLPFLETPSPLYVETSVLKRYFPSPIADWMTKRAGEYDERVEAREGVIRLPRPEHLPVVFGARLSLSFPVLLSALPLMTPDFAKGRNVKGFVPLRHVWFSDGGMTSNFPIHFFDSPIPSRPTFCLNLVDFDSEVPDIEMSDSISDQVEPENATDGQRLRANKPIAQPRAPARAAASRPEMTPRGDPEPGDDVWGFVSTSKGNRLAPIPFTAFDTAPGTGVASFFQTLLNTARFWSDNQMLVAPGVRDRVVNIALREDEGGLNFDMNANVIADLDRRGRAAGLLIAARFDPKARYDPESGKRNEEIFANHRWVRFRNFMAAFEDLSRRFARSRRTSDAAAKVRGESLLETMIKGEAAEKLGYPAPRAARDFYNMVTDEFEQLALKMAAATRADERAAFDRPRSFGQEPVQSRTGAAPRPKMRARLRPLVDNDPRAEIAELPDPSDIPHA
jgi:predicted acylesterase/phospholipase RssA